jgi:hypothetical protein
MLGIFGAEKEDAGENFIIRNLIMFTLRKILLGISNPGGENGQDIYHACEAEQWVNCKTGI